MNTEITNGQLVKGVQSTLGDADFSVSALPRFLKTVILEEAWRCRVLPHSQEIVEFGAFEDFVTEDLLEGLGTTIEHLKNICAADTEAIDLIDQAVQNPNGGDRRSKNSVDNIHTDRPSGTSQTAALRRLRKSRPDLHSRVIKDELSANAAMIEAGFRQKTLNVPLDPEKLAHTIKRHFNEEQIAKLIALLLGAN